MRIFSAAGASMRHTARALAEAALVAAIIAALVFAYAVTVGTNPAGAGKALARSSGGSLSATISFAGYAAQPKAVSGPVAFAVTRSVASDTVFWVYNYCWDASNHLLSTDAKPVVWGTSDSLEGATHSFDLTGTHCKALVTIRPWSAKPLGDAVMTYDVN